MSKATDTTKSKSTSDKADHKLVTAHARGLHIAPRKVRLVTNAIKNMAALDALVQLQHMNKKAAPMVAKLLRSAVANAENNFNFKAEHLFIKTITADMGTVMKRYFPRARGSAFVIRRKMSHVNIELEERKKGKSVAGKTSIFRKSDKTETTQSIDAKEATNIKPETGEVKKTKTVKSSEQVKESKVAQKRRLFNRKTGV